MRTSRRGGQIGEDPLKPVKKNVSRTKPTLTDETLNGFRYGGNRLSSGGIGISGALALVNDIRSKLASIRNNAKSEVRVVWNSINSSSDVQKHRMDRYLVGTVAFRDKARENMKAGCS